MAHPMLLSPILIAQLLTVALRTPRLPEALGARAGRTGKGAGLRLLVLGDSSAAGVGVAQQQDALMGQVLAHLGAHPVDWQLVARSGATSGRALHMLDGAGPCDVAITALGVNDVLRHTGDAAFRAAQAALLDRLRDHHGARAVLVSAVPPMGAFAAFPEPLRGHLGARAARLDAILQDVCAQTGAQHVPFDIAPTPDLLARDGLHPSARLYRIWGARMAGLVLRAVS